MLDLLDMPRQFPQFGKHLSSLVRPASEVFKGKTIGSVSLGRNRRPCGCGGGKGACGCGGDGSCECNGRGRSAYASSQTMPYTPIEYSSCQSTTTDISVQWNPPPTPPSRKGRCPCLHVLAECQWAIMDMPYGGRVCERQAELANIACLRYAACLTEVDSPEDLMDCPPVPSVPKCLSCETLLDKCLSGGRPPRHCGHEYVRCMGCVGLPTAADSAACEYPDSYCYSGAKAGCFCRCAGDTPWAQEVRGCLRCLYDAGVDPSLAHAACYDSATSQGMDAPLATLAFCFASCASPDCVSISTDITDWQPWEWR